MVRLPRFRRAGFSVLADRMSNAGVRSGLVASAERLATKRRPVVAAVERVVYVAVGAVFFAGGVVAVLAFFGFVVGTIASGCGHG